MSFHIYPEVSIHLAAGNAGSMVETFDPDLPGGNPLDPSHLLVRGGPRLAGGRASPPDVPGLGFEPRLGRLPSLSAPSSRRRSSARRILPVTVSGSSSTNSIARGTSKGASRLRTCCCSSATSSADPVTPGTEDDERLHHLAAHRIGNPDRGSDGDGRVADEALLDLARADAVAAARDEVVDAADAPVVALVVDLGEVARVQPAVAHLRGRCLLVAPVAEHHHRVPFDPNGDLTVDEPQLMAWVGPSHPAGPAGHAAQLPIRRFASVCP